MCGIVGYFSAKKLDESQMLQSLIHRGPDDSGEIGAMVEGRHLWLGHRRLSIIDLSRAANQPMKTYDGTVLMIVNGEIYNYKELKERYLNERKFVSKSDSEVILAMYEKYGIDCLRFLNGDYAICIIDLFTRKLVLARDRLGVKPLYYYDYGETFAFASELKAIISAGIPLQLDEGRLQEFFVFKYTPGNNTLFHDVFRLPPASFLEYDLRKNSFHIEKYWELKKDPVKSKQSFEDARENLIELASSATRIRLMSDVPMGTFFSGGLDSSTIAYFIKERSDIIHYSARKSMVDLKKEGSSSDFHYARKLAIDWHLQLVPIEIGNTELTVELIRQVINYADDLIADGALIPSFLIAKEAGKTSRVLLSGMGGDELFLGYAGHQISLMASLLDKWPKLIQNCFAKFAASLNQGKGVMKPYRRYLHKMGKYYNHQRSDRYGAYNVVGDVENSLLVYPNRTNLVPGIFRSYFDNDEDLFDQLYQFEMQNFLIKNLNYLDRMTMANSIEGRVPFLDHRLVEFSYSLPREFKLSNFGRTKVILREAMRPILPKYLIQRRKAGFGMPLRSIFSSRKKIDEMLDRKFFYQFGGFDLSNIEKIINKHLSGVEDTSNLIYALISFQEWHKIFIQGEAV